MILLGFLLLIIGADFLIKGSSKIAKKFHIPEILIGLTIVALGTSAPELIITLTSASKGANDLIIGNAVGSNLCNLLLILPITCLFRPIKLEKETRKIHLPVAFYSTVAVICLGKGILGFTGNQISRIEGLILVILYFIYFLYPISIEIKDIRISLKKKRRRKRIYKGLLSAIIFVVIGIINLRIGGNIVVDEATRIALDYNIPERVIGLTIVAIGTALPELITSIMAVIKKEGDLAEGNLIGSCILNSFLIIGTGAIITPLSFSQNFINSFIFLSFVIALIWIFCKVGRKNRITRDKAIILLALYFVYMISLFI